MGADIYPWLDVAWKIVAGLLAALIAAVWILYWRMGKSREGGRPNG